MLGHGIAAMNRKGYMADYHCKTLNYSGEKNIYISYHYLNSGNSSIYVQSNLNSPTWLNMSVSY